MSAIIPYFNAKVEPIRKPDGTRSVLLSFTNKKVLQQYLVPLVGKQVQVSIRKPKTLRSLNQNNYFHGVILTLIAEDTGQPLEDVKKALKAKFCPKKDVLGEMVDKSTAELSKAEFWQFCDDCKLWALEFRGIDIPDPNSVNY